jgi:hypothetical protein
MKAVPSVYLAAPQRVRHAVLQGLMDRMERSTGMRIECDLQIGLGGWLRTSPGWSDR